MPLTPEEEARLSELQNKYSASDNFDSLLYGGTEEDDVGFISNVGRKMGEAAGEIVGGFAGTAEDIRQGVTGALGGDLRVGYNLRDEDSGFDIGIFDPEEIAEQGTMFASIEEAGKGLDLGSEERYTLQRLKDDPSLLNILGFGAETTGVSLVHMAGMVANLPAYFTSRENTMADERAANDGGRETTFSDYVAVAPGNAVETLLDKFMFKRMTDTKAAKKVLEESGYGSLAGEVVKRIGQEAATEGLIQEPASYLATHVGTEKGVSKDELSDVVLGGAIGGAFGGAVIGGPLAAVQRKNNREAKKVADQALVDEKLDKVRQVDAMNAQVLVDTQEMQTGANDVALARRQEEQLAKTQARSDELMREPTPKPIVEAAIEEPVETTVAEVFTEEATTQGRTNQQTIDEAFQEGARSRGVGGNIPDVDLAQEFRTEDTTAKRDKEDVVAKVVSNKAKRKQARAERVLENPKSSDEAVERAEELLIEVEEETAVVQAKDREQKVKRKKEDLVDIREGFLAGDKKVTGRKKNELIQIAESLGLDVQPTKGKKSVSVPQYREAISIHPDVVIAEVKPTVDTIDAAFKPIPKEDTVEAPVESVAPVTKVTPTPTITEEKVKKELSLDTDGVTVIDQEGMPVEQSAKVRARFFKKLDIPDPELLAEGDRGLTDLQKAEKRLRSLEYQDQAQTEQGGLTPRQVAEKDKLVVKIDRLRKDEKDSIQISAMESMIKTNEALVAKLEGVNEGSKGQADVVVDKGVDLEIEEGVEVAYDTDEGAFTVDAKAELQELQDRLDKAEKLKDCIGGL